MASFESIPSVQFSFVLFRRAEFYFHPRYFRNRGSKVLASFVHSFQWQSERSVASEFVARSGWLLRCAVGVMKGSRNTALEYVQHAPCREPFFFLLVLNDRERTHFLGSLNILICFIREHEAYACRIPGIPLSIKSIGPRAYFISVLYRGQRQQK